MAETIYTITNEERDLLKWHLAWAGPRADEVFEDENCSVLVRRWRQLIRRMATERGQRLPS